MAPENKKNDTKSVPSRCRLAELKEMQVISSSSSPHAVCPGNNFASLKSIFLFESVKQPVYVAHV